MYQGGEQPMDPKTVQMDLFRVGCLKIRPWPPKLPIFGVLVKEMCLRQGWLIYCTGLCKNMQVNV